MCNTVITLSTDTGEVSLQPRLHELPFHDRHVTAALCYQSPNLWTQSRPYIKQRLCLWCVLAPYARTPQDVRPIYSQSVIVWRYGPLPPSCNVPEL
ncbi:hypothetical protein CY34DRAFT_199656 [Suillus luteus UH-Slu-Lm8-n1]|uniref:Uncharacterized protein n=1 Tax=Suillus luteus UH-Slu-Lm8-n1 TaxID=930992 RepID=A0A0D0AI84_9AGAM|nr:hypothetical protein CY34DRAFT_199656 [Suillus luteus UH-Slu-Lm8-n1]